MSSAATPRQNKKLGKHPKKTDLRTLHLARYLKKLPAPPSSIDHYSKLPKNVGMMGNDTYGDCTIAAAGHMVMSWTAYAATLQTISDKDILAAYEIISPNDDGATLLDALNLWRKTGVGGEKVEAFVETGTADLTQAKLAIQYFGSLYIGISLPDTNTFGPWDVTKPTWRPDPNNGHCVPLIGYDDTKKVFKAVTWGEVVDMSYDWFQKYSDESYAVLDDISLIKASGKSPEGFDWAALQDDLAHLGDPIVAPPSPNPSPTPTPTPVPVPTPTPIPPNVPGPIVLVAKESANWVVYLDGKAQTPSHPQQADAVEHADTLRYKKTGSVIEIRCGAVFSVR